MSAPRITLVTPAFNSGRYLEAALESVFAQDYPNLEYFVLDGGSTDDSRALLEKHDARIDWWVSEPDDGQAAAINAGVARATGDILGWLNADDLLGPGALRAIGGAWTPETGLVAGPVIEFFDDPGTDTPDRTVTQEGLSFEALTRPWELREWHQPGIYMSRSLWERTGPLNVSLRYAMDYDWMLRALPGCAVVHVDTPIVRFRRHAAQKTTADAVATVAEIFDVLDRVLADRGDTDRSGWGAHRSGMLLSAASTAARQGRLRDAARITAEATRRHPGAVIPAFLKKALGKLTGGRGG
ncbi:MAG: glycosyltransferase family 2 protein [Planctomycetota bacterium]|jgi:hypothetical protein